MNTPSTDGVKLLQGEVDMAKSSGGSKGGGIVGRARRRGGVVDIGQLSKQEKKELRAAIKAGKVVKVTSYDFPIPKPWYIGA